jgi:proline dehydrogenase
MYKAVLFKTGPTRNALLFSAQRQQNLLLGKQFYNAYRSISSTNEKKTLSTVPPPVVDSNSNSHTNTSIKETNYLDALTTKELLGYLVIGMATINSPILNLVIKLFPFTPLWLIKTLVYQNYCGGDNLPQVLKTGERLAERGIKNMMVSYTVEACDGKKMSVSIPTIIKETELSVTDALIPHTVSMIEDVVSKVSNPSEINKVINEIPPGYVALKPTGLIENAAEILLNYENPNFKEKFNELVKNCESICEIAVKENRRLKKIYPSRQSPFVVIVIDAERNDLQQGVYKLQRELMSKFNRSIDNSSKPTVGDACVVGTVQMYLKESTPILNLESELANKNNYILGWKLVRGAYIHSEPDRGVIHDTKEDTDKNYDAGIYQTIANMNSENPTVGHLVVASHNGNTQLKATELLKETKLNVRSNVVLGQLLGMADNITYDLIKNHETKNIIKYVPWGPPLETKEYLLRRLEENGDAVRADSGLPLVKGILSTFFRRIF